MLTLAEANQAIAAALARAQRMKMEIAVSVCDEGGRLVAFQRMDGVFSEAIPLAIGRAIAAAALRKSSGDKDAFLDLKSVWRVAGAGLPIISGPGGLPIIRNDQTVGAIGVCGSANGQRPCALRRLSLLSLPRYAAHKRPSRRTCNIRRCRSTIGPASMSAQMSATAAPPSTIRRRVPASAPPQANRWRASLAAGRKARITSTGVWCSESR
jgi:glc operon protein GlcG